MDKKFWQVLGFQKGQKHPKNDLSAPLDTQEAVLGELIFGGENEDQIQKFHLCWKVDRKKFPTIPLGANLDIEKASKISSKLVRRIEKSGSAHWGFLLILDSVTLFFAYFLTFWLSYIQM